jgi:hypothetical protein
MTFAQELFGLGTIVVAVVVVVAVKVSGVLQSP